MKSVACWIVSETISAYVDQELTEGERAAMDRHLASCDRCAQMHRRMTTTVRRSKDLIASPLPASSLLDDIMEQVHQTSGGQPVRRWPMILRFPPFQEIAEEWQQAPLTTCAALMLGVLLGVIRVCG